MRPPKGQKKKRAFLPLLGGVSGIAKITKEKNRYGREKKKIKKGFFSKEE